MTEIVRRPGRLPVFVQVLVAVLSGAAAMYAVQNIKGAPGLPVPQAPAPPAPTPLREPRRETRAERSRLSPPKPARPGAEAPRSAMLVVPERGGARGGMLHVAGEGAPLGSPGSEIEAERRLLKSSRGGVRQFDPVDWRGIGKGKGIAAPPLEKGKSGPALISRGAAPDEGAGLPAAAGPLSQAPEFWDRDRVLRVGAAALLALAGLLFLFFGTRIVETAGAQGPPDGRR